MENLRGWLTTVTARVCLDVLRTRKTRREEPIGTDAEMIAAPENPERDALMTDSVGVAMLVVLETLTPPERVAFVLHDIFDVAFEDIAPIVNRSPAAARQLASRARRRVQGQNTSAAADQIRQREVVEAFVAAARGGDFAALLAMLDPDVVLQADAAAVEASLAAARVGAPALPPEIRGQEAVAKIFHNRAKAAQIALVEGDVGLVFAHSGIPRMAVDFVIDDGRIVEISMVANPARLAAMDVRL